MKKYTFFILTSLIFGAIKPNSNDNAHLALCLADNAAQVAIAVDRYQKTVPSQHNYLRNLYWTAINNPNFPLLPEFRDKVNYFLVALSDHIKTLEDKIAQNKSGLQSWSMLKGVSLTGFAALFGYVWKSFKNKNINSYFLMDEALRSNALVGSAFGAIGCTIGALHYFHKVSRYNERLHERLERDKKLLELMQATKVDVDKARMIDAASQLIEIVSGVIIDMIQPQQPAVLPVAAEAVLVETAAIEGSIETVNNEIEEVIVS